MSGLPARIGMVGNYAVWSLTALRFSCGSVPSHPVPSRVIVITRSSGNNVKNVHVEVKSEIGFTVHNGIPRSLQSNGLLQGIVGL